MPAVSLRLKFHTHWESNEQGLYTCTPTASMFVCFYRRCTTRPWTPVKVMLVCDGGEEEAPRPGLESPIGTQCPGEGSAPTGGTAVQWRDCGGALTTLKMQHRYCFTQGQVLLQLGGEKNARASLPLELALTHINRPDSCPRANSLCMLL